MSQTINESIPGIDTAEKLGLSENEYHSITEILGRQPNFTELSIFSVMWSEHCSYKNSIKWLKTLPREGGLLLTKAGEENAGLIDIGNNLACAFKIESHNHPSAIEPYQGAATGVGGIHRDIFTMGARPVAALNSLRFGNIHESRTRHLLRGVVKGIGDYGNAFGVPTVAGEVFFDESFHTNPLVNAMSVGIVEKGKTVSAIAKGVGNPVYIVGSATGKDGIHGATFASADITEESAEKLPSVQVGDPFQEKLLLEATLEAIATGAIVGMQDMGAAGITCSTSEMSAKGESGMKINLDKVPTRQEHMKPFEILLSESQERMLIVVEKGKEKSVEDVFAKWELNCVQIGEVTDTRFLEFYFHGELVADIPAHALVLGGGAPVYEREFEQPDYIEELHTFDPTTVREPVDYNIMARKLIQLPNVASKRWIFEQYDSMVGINNTSTNAPSDAAVIRIKDSEKALAVTVDCNSRYVFAHPYTGAMIAVCEAARNIVCSGGRPAAITNCLNFGNPYNPHVYWQFVEAIKGMGDACRALDTPVTGGNVSFYNQSADDGPVFPTPTIGMVGVIDDLSKRMTLNFKNPLDSIYVLGMMTNDISSSEYLTNVRNIKSSPAPYFNLEEERLLQEHLYQLIQQGLVESAHDCADGGLFVALLESSMPDELGFDITTDSDFRKDAYLFGESQSRVVVSVSRNKEDAFIRYLMNTELEFISLGQVTSGNVVIDEQEFGHIDEWKKLYHTSIEGILQRDYQS
ncbi:MAG: phosphoribosylformylglycinamidine synthase subunit PurL [Bacteroidetes bacterium]|nr:phosphoribosylformylglycinamidine synthase subunit PurL [Bacteroidota bacterium]